MSSGPRPSVRTHVRWSGPLAGSEQPRHACRLRALVLRAEPTAAGCGAAPRRPSPDPGRRRDGEKRRPFVRAWRGSSPRVHRLSGSCCSPSLAGRHAKCSSAVERWSRSLQAVVGSWAAPFTRSRTIWSDSTRPRSACPRGSACSTPVTPPTSSTCFERSTVMRKAGPAFPRRARCLRSTRERSTASVA